jgi:hypothetical protein
MTSTSLPPDEIEQMLASHQLYLDTEYHEGHRANFSSTDRGNQAMSCLWCAMMHFACDAAIPETQPR